MITQAQINNYYEDARKAVPKSSNVIDQIQQQSLEAYGQDIEDWKNARLAALDPYTPTWWEYIRVCDEISRDVHIKALFRNIEKSIIAKEFVITIDEEEDEQLTAFFKDKWFSDYIKYFLKADLFPYSLIYLNDLNEGTFSNLKEVPPEYVNPSKKIICKYPYSIDYSGWKYNEPPLVDYYIFNKSSEPLGLCDALAPLYFAKKYMQIYWLRFSEKFGIPFLIGKTDIKDNQRRKKMNDAFANVGSSMNMVISMDDEVDMLESSKTDAYQIFKELGIWANNEMSKLIAGAVGVLDEKAFVGNAEVGERVTEMIINSYVTNLEYNVNNELILRLVKSYGLTKFEGAKIKFLSKEKRTFKDTIEALKILVPKYNISPEEIKEKTGIEIEGLSVESENKFTVMNKVDDLYNKIMHKHGTHE